MDVQPGSASTSNLKIDQSESRKLSVFSNLTRKQSTAIGAKKKRVIKGNFNWNKNVQIIVMVLPPIAYPKTNMVKLFK